MVVDTPHDQRWSCPSRSLAPTFASQDVRRLKHGGFTARKSSYVKLVRRRGGIAVSRAWDVVMCVPRLPKETNARLLCAVWRSSRRSIRRDELAAAASKSDLCSTWRDALVWHHFAPARRPPGAPREFVAAVRNETEIPKTRDRPKAAWHECA